MQPTPLVAVRRHSRPRRLRAIVKGGLLLAVLVVPAPALAADAAGPAPGLAWGLPFLGILLSIALFPILAPRLWHRRMGVVAAAWAAALVVPTAVMHGPADAAAEVWHAILTEYLPFVTLLLALFSAGGGILLRGGGAGTPGGNTGVLALGTVLAGLMGTTGAAMVLIHPLLRANEHRSRKVHIVVFFMILVANAGGALTPLGDPPLYIGFLHGVPFLWPAQHLAGPLLVMAALFLTAFWLYDRHACRHDGPPPPREPFRMRGWPNVGLILVVIATVLLQGIWRPGDVVVLGQAIGVERLVGIAVFGLVAIVSVGVTPRAVRQGNMFTWHPIEEVAKLFAAIFVTIGPVMAMLGAGLDGPLAGLLRLTLGPDGAPSPLAYFWLTGVLSAFLDNAPTYLVFFQLAGGDPVALTGPLNHVLTAIAAGAVFFGALTYIGNAPNLMIRSIASHRGVRMPGFFIYLGTAALLLAPAFVVVSALFFL